MAPTKETVPDSDYAVQANFKFGFGGQDMLNVRGKTVAEFAQNLADIEEGLNAILSISEKLHAESDSRFATGSSRGEELIKSDLGGEVSARKCEHGWMQLKSGNGGKGPWSAYMCPAPKGTPGQCKPIDAKTGKPWG